MTKSYISCYNMPYKDLQNFEVPDPVYIYIRQLENEIINRNGAVQRLYKFRFKDVRAHWDKKGVMRPNWDNRVEGVDY